MESHSLIINLPIVVHLFDAITRPNLMTNY